MGGQHIGQFRLLADIPQAVFLERGQAVHAGDHRAGGVLHPDRRRDRIGPRPRRIRVAFDRAHAVALIAEVPRGNRGLVPQFRNQMPHHPHLPLQRGRVGQHIDAGKRRRHEHPPRHPSGDQPDDQPEPVFGGIGAQRAEALHHHRIDSRAPCRRIRQRLFAEAHLHKALAPRGMAADRLEVRPQRKHPQHLHSVFTEQFQVGTHRIGVPFAPHRNSGMAGPVVAADEKTASGLEHSTLRLFAFL